MIMDKLCEYTPYASFAQPFFESIRPKHLFESKEELEEDGKHISQLKQLWEYFVVAMILYFLVTLANAILRF